MTSPGRSQRSLSLRERVEVQAVLPRAGREVASIAFCGEGLENRSGVDLLKWMENQKARGAFRGQPAYDFAGLWAELGLDRPGRCAGSAGAGPPWENDREGALN